MGDLDRKELCECGSKMDRQITTPIKDSWKPITLEHINVEGEGPLHFEKKRDLINYCNKHNLESGALL